jgi:hypothetical protein
MSAFKGGMPPNSQRCEATQNATARGCFSCKFVDVIITCELILSACCM